MRRRPTPREGACARGQAPIDHAGIDRRALIGSAIAAAAAVVAGPPAGAQVQKAVQKSVQKPAPKGVAAGPVPAKGRAFFTAQEFATLDELAEMIIPADAVSGGARATGVAAHLDQRIGESLDPAWRKSWRDDLAEIDRLSVEMFGRPFVKASLEQRTRLMQRVSGNEANPSEPGEYAFGTIKWSVADAYYRTRIGIHDDLKYKGNVIQDEFSGIEVGSR